MVLFSNILTIYDVVKNKSYSIASNDEVYYAEESNSSVHGILYEQRCNIAVLSSETDSLNHLLFAIVTFTDDQGENFIWGSRENPILCNVTNEKTGIIIKFSRDSTTSLFN